MSLHQLSAEELYNIKQKGFSDRRIAQLISGETESSVRNYRWDNSVRPVYKRVDTCAAEFATNTAYMYSTYEQECEAQTTDKKKIMVLGGGPNRIGQGIEFDYCCVHAALAMRDDGYETETDECIAITHGYSKDLRPDMKQFMMDALCIEGAIPLLGATLSGNKADKKANNTELTRVASLMKKHKLDPKAYIYIADSALVSADNLEALKQQPFITRLPGNYAVEKQAIDTAFQADDWTYVGALAEHVDPSKKRTSARYKLYETQVELYDTTYRAIVVHSTSHDKRRLKKTDKQIAADQDIFKKLNKELSKINFSCRADAQRHADALLKKTTLNFHQLKFCIEEDPIYERGRPKQGQPRNIKQQRYQICAELLTLQQKVDKVKERSGCFVLISNVPTEDDNAHDATEILTAYKQQYGIEMNFRFLKDPIIVNDTFLKKPERIEALGFILLLSLMVWNLIQHIIRKHIKQRDTTILGWDNKQTKAPTTMMVFFYFQHISIFVWNRGLHRKLSRTLKPHQKDYLCAMGLPESIFTTPVKTYRN